MPGSSMFRLVDKLIFALAFLAGLQVPQLAAHYHQYLSGYHDALSTQVEGYQATAYLHDYAGIEAMIADHLDNPAPSVRTDAQQKQVTLAEYERLEEGVEVFSEGNLLQQSLYMFHPSRYGMLENVMGNFEPGVPLTTAAFVSALLLALLVNACMACPLMLFRLFRRRGKAARAH